MDELDELQSATAGERLRSAREERGLQLDDIAAQTRIPRRHLESIELGEWDKLPAPTYTIGFARSYASAVGLDRAEIADQLRAEMGGQRAATTASAEVFEPADPARTMPKWLVLGAIAAVILLVALMSWLRSESLKQDPAPADPAAPAATAPAAQAPAAAPATPQGPVVITANEPVWLSVEDGTTTLTQVTLQAGQSYQVPATATRPVLTTGKPEALRIAVGTADAPPVGAPATTVRDVSLLPADLMRGGAPAPGAATQAPPAAR